MNKRTRKAAIVVVLLIAIFACVAVNKLRRTQENDDYTKFNGTWKVIALQCEARVPMGESPLGMSFVCEGNLSSIEWMEKRFVQRSKRSVSGEEVGRTYNLVVNGFDDAVMIEYQEEETSKGSLFNMIVSSDTLYLLMGGEEYTRGIYLLEKQG